MAVSLSSRLTTSASYKILLSLLPRPWRSLARKTGAFTRPNVLRTPLDLLRLLMLHVSGLSLRGTVARATHLGWRSLKAETLQDHVERCGKWLEALAQGMAGAAEPEEGPAPSKWQREQIAVDATGLRRPGGSAIDYRLHVALSLRGLCCRAYRLTGVKTGESFKNFTYPAHAIVLGDRGYCSAGGIAWVQEQKADALVKVNVQNLPMYTAREGERLDLGDLGRGMATHECRGRRVWIRTPEGTWIEGRVVLYRLSRGEARRARQRLQKERRKRQTPSAESWALAIYHILFTTLGAEWTDRQILNLYPFRWQVELFFKRLKSLLRLGDLPKRKEETGRAWLQGKILLLLWIEALNRAGGGEASPPLEDGRVRSVWREFEWWLEQVLKTLSPPVGLVQSLRNWPTIQVNLSEPKRKRACVSATL